MDLPKDLPKDLPNILPPAGFPGPFPDCRYGRLRPRRWPCAPQDGMIGHRAREDFT